MAAYLLFFPTPKTKGNPGKDPQHFTDAGFPEGFYSDQWVHGPVIGKSPSGGKGVVYSPRGRAGYFATEQHWEKREGYWLGRWKDKPLLPADIERHNSLGGVPTKLADGKEWLVPVPEQMPHGHFWDGETWKREIKQPYREYWDQTLAFYQMWFAAFSGGDESATVAMDWAKGASFASLALGFNYYLTPHLMGDFELLDDDAIRSVQLAAMQAKLIAYVHSQQKKSTPATSNSFSGNKG